MNNARSKNTSGTAPLACDSVVLFPLCDKKGDLSRVLSDARQEPGVRADALIFAWLLDLPPHIPARAAAGALLAVIQAGSQKNLSGRQRALIRELKSIHADDRLYRGRRSNRDASWDGVVPAQAIPLLDDASPDSCHGTLTGSRQDPCKGS